ncbi:MAG: 16S rRNA (cytosine(1402)-N(4))-methyltransferase RsmH [Pseudomonadales bacterium]|nr:16S rRNA (cytosine(1402)-N(4))-methyltransferase RsmH [Pseudomonadales bacterium]MDP6825941.1 16S rRNA (cytosine(1402)-N(4))-methyltransferase RsmH [Pseudomonadales bacterium]MDP6972253.1 16S rRNA (cytosine(1402)-N(4))-methyltransferase RsmH [Pseudomonadales bacterium]
MNGDHEPVLRDETVSWLTGTNGSAHGDFVDATFGRGGHSTALLERLTADSRLLVLDRDVEAYQVALELAGRDTRITAVHGSFEDLGAALVSAGMERIRGAMMDLGVSSPQLDRAERGFSFSGDGPLDMRMDQSRGTTAAQWLNSADEQEIGRVLKEYGEERYARRIARAIVAARPLSSTVQLAQVVVGAQPRHRGSKHGATRTFQAVRIQVNAELDQVKTGLLTLFSALQEGGRLAVISFHSLEDRIVKRTFRDWSRPASMPRRLPITVTQTQVPGRVVAGPVRAGESERRHNPRARSATLRVIERLEGALS